MKKIILTIISLILALTCAACSSCGADVPNLDDYPEKGQETVKAPETGKYIFRQGVTDYSIVVSSSANQDVNFAAGELQYFVKDATGVQLPIIGDAAVTYTEQSKFICVGENEVLNSAGISLTAEEREKLQSSGLRVITKDSSLFLFGGTDAGTIYAVYEWLERELGYEYFTENIWSIDKDVTEIPLRAYNEQVIPDYDVRFYSYPRVHDSYTQSNRLKLNYPHNYKDLKIMSKVLNDSGEIVSVQKKTGNRRSVRALLFIASGLRHGTPRLVFERKTVVPFGQCGKLFF